MSKTIFMKKSLLILLVVPTVSFSQVQTQSIQIDAQSTNDKEQIIVLESSTEIVTPKSVDFSDYSHLALVTINNLGSSTKGWYKIHEERLLSSPLTILNPFKVDEKKATTFWNN